MLQEIVFVEAVIKRSKGRLKEMGVDTEGLEHEGDRGPEVEAINRQMFVFRTYANAIRSIGDSIAWRTLGYDRAVLRLMCGQATKQQVMSEGLMEELLQWSIRFDSGEGIAILNSLTNCLAIGDVTLVREDGSAEVIEVKSGNTKSRRKIRQKREMREIAALLSTGGGKAEGKDVEFETLPIQPQAGLEQIRELLSRAEQQGWAGSKISNCLYVDCLDLTKLQDAGSAKRAMEELEATARETIGAWEKRGDDVLDRNSLDLIAFSPNCAPFAVFPFSNRTCVDLLTGGKCYTAYLNIDAVAREFEYRGWTIEKTPRQLVEERNYDSSLIVRKEGFHAGVTPADFMRMHMEALRPQTVISSCEVIFKRGPRGKPQHVLALYEGEAELWD